MRARLVGSVLMASVLYPSGCGSIPFLGFLNSGITGTILAGPQCSVVMMPPQPGCEDQPIQATVIVRHEASGIEVTRFTSAADGTFRVNLQPGRYTLDPQPSGGLTPSTEHLAVTVTGGDFANVDIMYDTGIR